VLESGYLYFGNPVQQKRTLTEREIEFLSYVSGHYVLMKESY
jgi:carbonic anhydrase/acetyltransferase-like protein (isoleucine patch superfamily)